MTCERYFKERGRIGAEFASHGEVARSQWDIILDAARAIRAGPRYVTCFT